jgi:hypothetical protein
MWAMIVMNWVNPHANYGGGGPMDHHTVADLAIRRGKVTFRQAGKRKRDAHPHLGAAAESRPSHQGDRLGAELDGQLSSPARSGALFRHRGAPIGSNLEDYDVLAEGAVVGRVFLSPAAPDSRPWIPRDRTPTHGYEPTREGCDGGIR